MRFLSRLLQEFARNPIQLVDHLDHVDRHTNGPRLIGKRTRDSRP